MAIGIEFLKTNAILWVGILFSTVATIYFTNYGDALALTLVSSSFAVTAFFYTRHRLIRLSRAWRVIVCTFTIYAAWSTGYFVGLIVGNVFMQKVIVFEFTYFVDLAVLSLLMSYVASFGFLFGIAACIELLWVDTKLKA